MVLQILSFLRTLKPTHILIGLLLVLGASTYIFYIQLQKAKEEAARVENNYTQLLNYKDSKILTLELKSAKEVEEFLDKEQGFKTLLEEKNVTIKKLQTAVLQNHTYLDTIKEVVLVIDSVSVDFQKPFVMPWHKKNECITITGSLEYKKDSLSINILSTKYSTKLVTSTSFEKQGKTWLGRLFRRRQAVVTINSSCGDTQTIIINRSKRGRYAK